MTMKAHIQKLLCFISKKKKKKINFLKDNLIDNNIERLIQYET